MPWRLQVVDGADAGRIFPLNPGSTIIGNSHKYSDICLNDLYVARVHCQIDVEDDRASVTAMADDKDTLVNGQKVKQHILSDREVLRVGNSHLRFEAVSDDGTSADDEIVEDYEVVEDGEVVDAEVVDAEVVEDVEVAAPVAAPAAAAAAELPELTWENLHFLTGHTLAHFELGELLGRGHHACVFRARDTSERREVAIKVLCPEFPEDPQELQRFAQNIKKIATIHEDHLVTWYAAGKKGDYIWISMELIEGESLAQVLKRAEPSTKSNWLNAWKIAKDLGNALHCLFERKMVHGNIVPTNILISLASRTVKLNDLLFQQALQGSVWQKKRLERKVLAELPYMAPEQLEENAYCDSLTDIYGLGAVVYHRLTGRPPFRGKDPGETISLIRAGKLEPPKKIIADMPDQFQTIVMKMMSPKQEDRYATPEKLLYDLESVATAR
jgi:hypothetical protein